MMGHSYVFGECLGYIAGSSTIFCLSFCYSLMTTVYVYIILEKKTDSTTIVKYKLVTNLLHSLKPANSYVIDVEMLL